MLRVAITALVALALLVAGCGGDDKPGYCSDVDDLEQSVKDLGDVDVVAGGTDAVTQALDEVEGNARAAVNAAKDDFPDQTAGINESISRLKTSAGQLAESPTAQQAARAAADVTAVVNSVDDFVDATKSECD